MFPCNNCSENNWTCKYIEGLIRATCNYCGNEVEFSSKKPGREKGLRPRYATDICLKCRTKLKIYYKNKKTPGKSYYFRIIRTCPKCKTIWLNPNDKVFG